MIRTQNFEFLNARSQIELRFASRLSTATLYMHLSLFLLCRFLTNSMARFLFSRFQVRPPRHFISSSFHFLLNRAQFFFYFQFSFLLILPFCLVFKNVLYSVYKMMILYKTFLVFFAPFFFLLCFESGNYYASF